MIGLCSRSERDRSLKCIEIPARFAQPASKMTIGYHGKRSNVILATVTVQTAKAVIAAISPEKLDH
jgi:hypothetical protein